MKLGTQAGLSPGHIALDGDPAPPPPKGHSPHIFICPSVRLSHECFVTNGCMDQDVTWYGGRPRPRRLCVRWGPRSPPPKGHRPPIFGPYMLRPNGCMAQDATWYGGRPRPGDFVLDVDPAPPTQKGPEAQQILGPCIVAKLMGGSRWYLARR